MRPLDCRLAKWLGLTFLATALWSPAARASEVQPIDFSIAAGKLNPHQPYAAKIRVLGAAITMGGAYDEMVTVEVHVGNVDLDLFGPHDQAVTGNVNDGREHHFLLPDTYGPGTKITITGRSWIMPDFGSVDPSLNSSWELRRRRNSNLEKEFVIVLRNGDAIPDVPGFMNQASIEDYVKSFIDPDSGKISLTDNQVIYLFELGAASSGSPTIDYQDLVVLVTLGDTPGEASLNEVPGVLFD